MRSPTLDTLTPGAAVTATKQRPSIALRAVDFGLKTLCITFFSLAAVAVEYLWNIMTGDAASLIAHFSPPLLLSGAAAGILFVAATPTAKKLLVRPSTYLLSQAATGVVCASLGCLLYYLFIGLLNLPFLPRPSHSLMAGITPFIGVLSTPFIITANALPYTLLIGSITGAIAGLMTLKRKAA
jgi:hypothetical protein